MNPFLPLSKADMQERGWEQADLVYVIGDAYVDHPSFGPAIISRWLESHGYRVAIISQPDWKDPASIDIYGRPRLGFLVSGGNMDPMVNHYTVAKKHRKQDAYSPGGEMGKRPDHATVVYCNLIRRSYRDIPIIIGSIEASLRRLAHYDYWSDSLKRSILLDSQADLLSYGMGERSILEIVEALDSGLPVEQITYVNGTVYKAKNLDQVYDYQLLPDFQAIKADKATFARSFACQYRNADPFSGKRLVEPYSQREYIVQNPPALPLSQQELDQVYALPYTYDVHPSYQKLGGVPAIKEVQFSLVSNRGCFGACNFCALSFHQGRIIQARSHGSLIEEAKKLIARPDFKGYIHDVGGPTADFRQPACEKQLSKGACPDRQCLFPQPCPKLRVDHRDYLQLLRALRQLPGVKKVFIRSGIRFDYVLADKDESFLRELCAHHVSGQLKVAPEHVSDVVLQRMGKPGNSVYRRFLERYSAINRQMGREQYVEPYLMSSHPGSTLKEAVELAEYLRDSHCSPEQVQDFYPTPSTISTCMYYTGLDPRSMEPVYVARNPHEKALQRALIQYRDPANHALVLEALRKAGRSDLIGFGPDCLIPPRLIRKEEQSPKKPGQKPAKKTGTTTPRAGSPDRNPSTRPMQQPPAAASRTKRRTAHPSIDKEVEGNEHCLFSHAKSGSGFPL